MNQYKITFGIEPTNQYLKAKQDVLQAWMSLSHLNEKERVCLMQEILDVINIPLNFNRFN